MELEKNNLTWYIIIFQFDHSLIHLIDNVGATLEKDLTYVLHQFLEKRDAVHGLSELYHDKVGIWHGLDCTPKLNKNGTVHSVYCHKPVANRKWYLHCVVNWN